ncbi:MAG: lipoyl protein ligase domain-containing protein, partial [Candidatus Fonsibacter sp.]
MQSSNHKIEIKISDKPVDYNEALFFLENRVQQLISKKKNELLWILEHNPVYTKGISAKNTELIDDKIFPVIETNRGGKFTFHGPGQKVVYVVLDLNIRGKEIKRFVR